MRAFTRKTAIFIVVFFFCETVFSNPTIARKDQSASDKSGSQQNSANTSSSHAGLREAAAQRLESESDKSHSAEVNPDTSNNFLGLRTARRLQSASDNSDSDEENVQNANDYAALYATIALDPEEETIQEVKTDSARRLEAQDHEQTTNDSAPSPEEEFNEETIPESVRHLQEVTSTEGDIGESITAVTQPDSTFLIVDAPLNANSQNITIARLLSEEYNTTDPEIAALIAEEQTIINEIQQIQKDLADAQAKMAANRRLQQQSEEVVQPTEQLVEANVSEENAEQQHLVSAPKQRRLLDYYNTFKSTHQRRLAEELEEDSTHSEEAEAQN